MLQQKSVTHNFDANMSNKLAIDLISAVETKDAELMLVRYNAVANAISEINRRSMDYRHVSRNDPRPCGSGKKFKNCHGKNL